MAFFDLKKQLIFYRSFHFDTINVLVHSVFVPTILFTSMGLLMNVPLPLGDPAVYNLGNAGCLGYGLFYLVLDLQGGLIAAPLLYLFALKNTQWLATVEDYNFWLGEVFVLSWVIQIVSHAVFEKRAPALLDNLLQALVLAPFFVLFEGLFLLGWRVDLKKEVDAQAALNIAEYKKMKNM